MIVLSVIAVALSVTCIFDFDDADRKLCDAGVYDLLTPELIEIYEREIACEKVVSQKTESQLARSAERLSVDVKKLKAIILLQDLAGRVNKDVSLDTLAKMNEVKLFGFFKQCGEAYLSTQSDERRAELNRMLSEQLPFPINF